MFALFRCVVFAALSSLSLTPIAHSEPSAAKIEMVGRIRVGYADLDLQKEEDARTLLGRLERAAYTACGGNPKFDRNYDLMPHWVREVYRTCRERAVSQAVADISSPTVSRLLAETQEDGQRKSG